MKKSHIIRVCELIQKVSWLPNIKKSIYLILKYKGYRNIWNQHDWKRSKATDGRTSIWESWFKYLLWFAASRNYTVAMPLMERIYYLFLLLLRVIRVCYTGNRCFALVRLKTNATLLQPGNSEPTYGKACYGNSMWLTLGVRSFLELLKVSASLMPTWIKSWLKVLEKVFLHWKIESRSITIHSSKTDRWIFIWSLNQLQWFSWWFPLAPLCREQ